MMMSSISIPTANLERSRKSRKSASAPWRLPTSARARPRLSTLPQRSTPLVISTARSQVESQCSFEIAFQRLSFAFTKKMPGTGFARHRFSVEFPPWIERDRFAEQGEIDCEASGCSYACWGLGGMPGKVFVNYRRDDAAGDARGVRDGLAVKFGKSNIFMDVDNLLAGQRFAAELAKALEACDVLIAIIGPRWMELLKAKATSGERDYVREEIAAALMRNIMVIPVRVGREGNMPALPRADDLPEDIRDLVDFQKHDVAHERFGRDMADLTQAITAVRKSMQPRRVAVVPPPPWV